MSVLRIMNSTGDTMVEWDTKNQEAVDHARIEFDLVIAQGYQAFRLDTPTEGEVIRDFDPDAETIIMSAPLVGG